MEGALNPNSDSVAKIYNQVYQTESTLGKPIMGTEIDPQYNHATKNILTGWCKDAPNGPILEIGAGSGNLSGHVRSNLPDRTYVAADISLNGLQIARKNSDQLIPTVADMTQLPYANETFAALIYADTLEHAPDIKKAIEEAHRVLIPGGILSVNVPTPKSIVAWILNLLKELKFKTIIRAGEAALTRKKMFGKANFQPYDADLEPDQWKELFENAGFEVRAQTTWPTKESGLNPLTALFCLRKKTQ